MSIKTLRKRIALVAVAALSFGVITGVSANAAGNANWVTTASQLVCSTSIDNDLGDDCTSLTGAQNQLVVTIDAGDFAVDDVITIKVVGGATIKSIDEVTVLKADEDITISADRKEATAVATDGAEDFLVALSATSAGTSTITVVVQEPDVALGTTLDKGTVTFIDAAGLQLSASSTNFGVYDEENADNWQCDDEGDAQTSAVVNQKLSAYSADELPYDGDSDLSICVLARNGLGALYTGTITGVISISGGQLDGTDFQRAYTISNEVEDIVIDGDGITFGKITISVTLIGEDGETVTKTSTVTAYGLPQTISAVSVQGAAPFGDDEANGDATPADAYADFDGGTGDQQMILVAALLGKDKAGNAVGDDLLSDAAQELETANLAVISSAVPGVSTLKRGTISTAGADVVISTSAANEVYGIFVDCSASQVAEKLTIRAYALDNNLATPAYVATNDITYYCSDAVSTVAVTPTAASGAAGSTLGIQVSVLDKNGFPAPDNTAVTLVAANGAGISAPSTVTNNGKLAKDATLLLGSAGPATVSATVSGKTASASIAVTGTPQATTDATLAALAAAIAKLQKAINKINKRLAARR